jgi:hypothetical protein
LWALLKTIELEFNMMSVKDLASNMIGEIVGHPESEDVVQTTYHGEVANLANLQELEVMAKVAGNASP